VTRKSRTVSRKCQLSHLHSREFQLSVSQIHASAGGQQGGRDDEEADRWEHLSHTFPLAFPLARAHRLTAKNERQPPTNERTLLPHFWLSLRRLSSAAHQEEARGGCSVRLPSRGEAGNSTRTEMVTWITSKGSPADKFIRMLFLQENGFFCN